MIVIGYTFGEVIRKLMAKREYDALVLRMRQAAVAEGANYMLYQLVQATPTGATAMLRQSTAIDYASNRTLARVGPTGAPSRYGGFVESGTRPHTPPFGPISYWVARVLGAPLGSAENRRITFGVMFAIRRRGTKPTHYVRNTWSRYRANAMALMERGAQRVLAEWGVGR